ncbi:MAG: hypothetical protein OEZ34_13180 [Spirochaetia bacterium]|nr:hypothetical protein [Spirochaetia bacterium]
MKGFILSFVELGYLTLQFPHELSVYMERMPKLRIMELIVLFFASLSFSTGLYQLRDYYSQFYLLHISLLASVVFSFLTLFFTFLSSYFDSSLASSRSLSAAGKTSSARSILHLSSFAFWFFHPASMILHLFNVSEMLLFPMIVLFVAWAMSIQAKGLQYLYEVTWRDFFKQYLFASGIAIAFPVIAVFSVLFLGVFS